MCRNSEPYLLATHVYTCVAGHCVVLLDLKRDLYIAIEAPNRLARSVKGWPVVPPRLEDQEDVVTPALSGNHSLSNMFKHGMLVSNPRRGKEATPVTVTPADSAIFSFDFDRTPHATRRGFTRMALAYTAAKWALKFRSLQATVQAVQRRKQRQSALDSSIGVERSRMYQLMEEFVYLRPFFFTARDECLLDSLTLVNYLAGYNVLPDWIFGVKIDPFYAHCWVQHGSAVFNDTPDHVRGFSPILVA